MNTTLSNVSEDGDVLKFTLSGLNVSLANAIRRVILSDIPTLAFYTETYNDNQCTIYVNTGRLHNEILKHRLSCIPIHMKELDLLPGKYILDLDKKNDTDEMIIITTEDFRVRNKENGNYLTVEEVRKIFPPFKKTNTFIDFARLRPRIGDSIPGEHIKLTCEFSLHTASENSMFNVVSKCSYGNTPDLDRIHLVWLDQENKLKSEGLSEGEIEFQKRNFYILDAQRHYVPDSFDFVLQTLGVFDNKELMKKACTILKNRMVELIQALESDMVPINASETTIENCYDVILEHEDYTIGKVLEYLLYEKFYVADKTFTYCGFKKFHPHNDDSTIRVAYAEKADKHMVSQNLRSVCIEANNIFKKISEMF
jgi:DNA-directed RNA polymerase alpha subunit